jgi:hypothetical protein
MLTIQLEQIANAEDLNQECFWNTPESARKAVWLGCMSEDGVHHEVRKQGHVFKS